MKLTVDQALRKANSHKKRGELDQARVLCEAVIEAFPGNTRAKVVLASLDKPQKAAETAIPSKEKIDRLTALYAAGRAPEVILEGTTLVDEFSSSFVLWNILGAAHMSVGQLGKAAAAFVKACNLKPDFSDAHNNLGLVLKCQGRLDDAIAAYERALSFAPDHADALNNMGNALKDQGKLDAALAAYERALALKPEYADALNNMGNALKDKGRLDDALAAYERALALKPDYADAYYNMGNVLRNQRKLDAALAAYERALALKPDYADVHYNMGNTLKDQGKLDDAIAAYERALALKPDYADAYNNMGNALKDQGQLDDALAAYERALALKPDYADALNNMGNVLKDQGRLDDALGAYERALALKPDHADALNNMGNTLKDQGRLDDALGAYERALALKPDYADFHYNMGNTLKEKGRLDDALAAYGRALALKPDYADVHYNMGNTLKDKGRLDDALAAYERVLALKPEYAFAYNNMGVTLQEQGKLDDAITAYESALVLKPDYASAEAAMLHQQQHVCDFSISPTLPDASARLGITTDAVPTFAALPWLDNPEHQLQRSITWANEKYTRPPSILPARPSTRPKRLKLGYFSADFHDHATLYLMAGLLRNHNKKQFEVFAYSYGRNGSGKLRKEAEQTVDHFFDVTDMCDHEIADLARSHCLDFAVDLKGYTVHNRTQMFQYRLAPIQLNYLGYPGSMGADFIDYIVADANVIPKEQREFYSERVIYLPHSYQPNDNLREIKQTKTSRTDFGLPGNAFVFCCFNNNYKISPSEFNIWMRLLTNVEGSILWLLKSSKWAEQNLRKEAAGLGVDPDRIVFAEKAPHAEHLARHKHADLFVDTFNVNAHTTASDALWGGLPVVTKQGKQFAARVAASLLNSVGLNELITHSEEEYEELIFELAMQPPKLREIRDKLNRNRLTEPLFDTERYTQNFEQGLQKAYDLYFCGKLPEDIVVSESI